jgi:hypothetical protein
MKRILKNVRRVLSYYSFFSTPCSKMWLQAFYGALTALMKLEDQEFRHLEQFRVYALL